MGEAFPDSTEGMISDLDLLLYNEEEEHLHYIELKQDYRNGRKSKASEQVKKAYAFWDDLNYTFSATEAYFNKGEIRHHPVLENEAEVRAEVGEAIVTTKEPHYSDNRIVEEEDVEAFVETDLPKGFGRRFKPEFELVRQLEQRFERVPDMETVRIAFYSHEHEKVMTKRLEPWRLFAM